MQEITPNAFSLYIMTRRRLSFFSLQLLSAGQQEWRPSSVSQRKPTTTIDQFYWSRKTARAVRLSSRINWKFMISLAAIDIFHFDSELWVRALVRARAKQSSTRRACNNFKLLIRWLNHTSLTTGQMGGWCVNSNKSIFNSLQGESEWSK